MNSWRYYVLPLLSTLLWLTAFVWALPKHGSELLTWWGGASRQYLSYLYSHSQYVKGELGDAIDDTTLYLYAGISYAHGADPSKINFEHPPLGKYLWGISWRYFGNPYLLNVLVVAIILGVFFVLGRALQISDSLIVMAQALLALILTPSSLLTALLDYQLLAVSLVFFLVLFSHFSLKVKAVLTGICLGALAGIKYPFPNTLPYILVLVLFFTHQHWRGLLLSLFCAALVYLSSYMMYFVAGHSLVDYLAFEKYRLSWWLGGRETRYYLIWQVFFLGKIKSWWDGGQNWQVDGFWHWLLPVSFVTCLSLLGSNIKNLRLRSLLGHARQPLGLMLIFSFAFLILYTFGSAPYARYLYVLFPSWILFIGKIITDKLGLNYQDKNSKS